MSRTLLDKLLIHSVANYQLLYNKYIFHNHNAHHLGSLYLLGVTDDKLEKAYQTMCQDLEPYEESPQTITLSNWRKHFGDKRYCKKLLLDNQKQPLINSVISGVVHPLIHIGYAFELNSQIVGIEAIAMTAVCYNYFHEVVDKLEPPSSPSKSALEIFKDIRSDMELPINDGPGVKYVEPTVKKYNDRILYHYNQWNMNREDLEKTMEELFELSIHIYGGTHKPNEIEYDTFLLHLFTGIYAVRTIFPHMNNRQIMKNIIQQFFYFAIVLYIAQGRPKINENLIHDYKIDEKKNWDYVIDRTLNTILIDNAHIVKVIRALKDAEKAYGDNKNGLYLKTAVKTVDSLALGQTFIGRLDDKRQLNILKRS